MELSEMCIWFQFEASVCHRNPSIIVYVKDLLILKIQFSSGFMLSVWWFAILVKTEHCG
jgi:hypothetical protein